MTRRIVPLLLCALVACTSARAPGVVAPRAPDTSNATAPFGSEVAPVERVVDGDTIIVDAGGRRVRVRLIGIDTPETVKPGTPVQCWGPEASARTKDLLPPGEPVRLVYDRERYDRYGRTLAYVYRVRDGLFVDLDLVARGFARVLDIPPDDRFAPEFAAAAARAESEGLGLWGHCGSG